MREVLTGSEDLDVRVQRETELLAAFSDSPPQWEPLSDALVFIGERCGCSEEVAFIRWKLLAGRSVISARADRETLDAYEIACSDRLKDRKNGLFLANAFRCVVHVESNVAELQAAFPALHFPNGPKRTPRGRAPTSRNMCREIFYNHSELLGLAGKQLYREMASRLKEKFPQIAIPSLETMERARNDVRR